MKLTILLLAPANSIHTSRWANGLAQKGHIVHLVSAHENIDANKYDKNISITILKNKAPFGYIFAKKELQTILSKIKPDIVNAHYATGYGLLARLSNARPLLLSVWGSDIYDFPNKTVFHRYFLKQNLRNADAIASTSNVMAKEMAKTYRHNHVFITPFGIDEDKFKPLTVPKQKSSCFTIGTVKTLAPLYGIDTLIKAFSLVKEKIGLPVHLEIVGSGPQRDELIQLCESLSLNEYITFTDSIPHQDVPMKLNHFDIYVALSNQESFGVAILEANACGLPVVVSDAEGLAEVVVDNHTGLIVPKNNPTAAAEAILKVINNYELKIKLGVNGQKHVLEKYSWSYSLSLMEQAYVATIKKFKN